MTVTGRLPENGLLSVDDVAAISRRERSEVLRAIDNRSLIARQQRGEWVVAVQDMRRWLSRR